MLEEIGNIVVFGLESRVDRWERCKEVLTTNGIKRVTRYATQKGKDIYKQTTSDFLDLLRLKRGNNLVFFEDDFELVDGWEKILRQSWSELPGNWDMLYLGCNLTKTPQRITGNIYRVRGAWCLHAVILNNKFIDYILCNYDINRRIVLDEWMRYEAQRKFFYMTYPMISYQRESYSDYLDKIVNYNIFKNKYYEGIGDSTRLPS